MFDFSSLPITYAGATDQVTRITQLDSNMESKRYFFIFLLFRYFQIHVEFQLCKVN